jgi:putative intracellular protease/amidase
MRRIVRFLIALACLILAAPPALAQTKGKVLLIAREHSGSLWLMLTKEVKPMMDLLLEAGYEVVPASDPGLPLSAGGATLDIRHKLSDVVVADYAGIVIPCMASAETENWLPDAALEIVKQAFAKGTPIAAQQSGVSILGYAGVLANRSWAAGFRNTSFGGTYKGEGVVQDGNLITSGTCPYLFEKEGLGADKAGTRELTERLIQAMQTAR